MKYIIYQDFGRDVAVVIFANTISHDFMQQELGILKQTLISAGFFMLINGQPFATGESITLNLKSRPEDAEIITNLLRG